MERYEDISKRLDRHDETLKFLHNSIADLNVSMKKLHESMKLLLPDLTEDVRILAADCLNRSNKGVAIQNSYVSNSEREVSILKFRASVDSCSPPATLKQEDFKVSRAETSFLLNDVDIEGNTVNLEDEEINSRFGENELKYVAVELVEKFVEGNGFKPTVYLKNPKQEATVSNYDIHFESMNNQANVSLKLLLNPCSRGFCNKLMHQLLDPKDYLIILYSKDEDIGCAHKVLDESPELKWAGKPSYMNIYDVLYAIGGHKPPKPPDYTNCCVGFYTLCESPKPPDHMVSATTNTEHVICNVKYTLDLNGGNVTLFALSYYLSQDDQFDMEDHELNLHFTTISSRFCDVATTMEIAALLMIRTFLNGSQTQQNEGHQSNCIHVVATNPYPISTPVYQPLEKSKTRSKGGLSDVETSTRWWVKIVNRLRDVSRCGTHTSSQSTIDRICAVTFSELVGGWVELAYTSSVQRNYPAIAIRCLLLKQQIRSPRKPETSILDYQSQHKVGLLMTLTCVFHLVSVNLIRKYAEMCTYDEPMVGDVYALVAKLESYMIFYIAKSLSICREACEEHDSVHVIKFHSLKYDPDVCQTFKGEIIVRVQNETSDIWKQYMEKFLARKVVIKGNDLRELMDTYLLHMNPLIAKWEGEDQFSYSIIMKIPTVVVYLLACLLESFMLPFSNEVKQLLIMQLFLSGNKEDVWVAKRKWEIIQVDHRIWIFVPLTKQLEDERVKWVGSLVDQADQPVKTSPKSKVAAKREITINRHDTRVGLGTEVRKHSDDVYDIDKVKSLTVVEGLGTVVYHEKIQNGKGNLTSNQKITTTHVLNHKQWFLVLPPYFTKGKQATLEYGVQESTTDLRNNSRGEYHDMQSLRSRIV